MEFDKLAGVPIAAIRRTSNSSQTQYVKLDLSSLQKADEATRRTLNYEDDKQTLADLEKQHGKLYVFGVMGKYQGAFVAMDAAQNLIATFGQRDLH
ncbi:MAG: hypothetical protein Q4B82_03480 [Alysiella sp.]|uniref:hypothetical protein n=1 Tax=Alysiella sp. TaxID=1872483 RepID=UPI0026DB5722|nr:hypothetical protein [Alysiella sp.]MDO4433624.1 hypothetical protein [Alysiella sp.]